MNQVPPQWIQVRLGDLVHFITSGSRNWAAYYNESGALFIRVGDLARGSIDVDFKTASRVLPPEGAEGERTAISVGDLLISITADIGLVGVATEQLKGGYVNQHIALAHPSQLIESAYLGWFLASPAGQAQLLGRNRGAVKAGLRLDDLKEILIPLAPAQEQRRLSTILRDCTDCLTRTKEAISAALHRLEEIERAALSAATSGSLTETWRAGATTGSRTPALAVNTVASTSVGMFEIPDSWKWVTLADVISYGPANGYSPRSGSDATGTQTLKLSATTQGKLILTSATTKRVYETVPRDSRFWLEPGDILVQRANALQYVGATAVYEGPYNSYIYPDLMMRVRIEDSDLRQYAALFLNSEPARTYLRGRATGTAGSMPKISASTLRELPFPLPPPDEVPHIVRFATELRSASERTRSELYRNLSLLESVRSAVLSAAFNGQWSTTEGEDELPTVLRDRVIADISEARTAKPRRKANRMRSTETHASSADGAVKVRTASDATLESLLSELGGMTTAAELWRTSRLPIDEFYKALRESVNAQTIRETKDKQKVEVRHAD